VSLVRGLTPRDALQEIGYHPRFFPTQKAARTWADHYDATHSNDTGAFSHVDWAGPLGRGWTIVVEDNGINGTPSADHLSRRGRAVVLYTSINADMDFAYAAGGHVVREFDPLLYSTVTGKPLRQERGIGFTRQGARWPVAKSLLLAYRLTGLRLTQRMLTTGTGRIGVVDIY